MGANTESESQLWERAVHADERAFTGLFDLHRDRVFRHVLRVGASRQDAEDVTAMAFFELWRKRRHVRVVEGSVLPWLLVTATNVARNSVRGTRRYASLLASLPRSADVEDPEEIVADRLERRRKQKQVHEVLNGLSEVDANLLLLVVLSDLRTADAATVLGITEGAARTRLHRAKARARGLLKDSTQPALVNRASTQGELR